MRNVFSAWQHEFPKQETSILLRGDWGTFCPYVETNVVMVAASRREERSGISPGHQVQPQGVVIKLLASPRSPTYRWIWPMVVPEGAPPQLPLDTGGSLLRFRGLTAATSSLPSTIHCERGRSA